MWIDVFARSVCCMENAIAKRRGWGNFVGIMGDILQRLGSRRESTEFCFKAERNQAKKILPLSKLQKRALKTGADTPRQSVGLREKVGSLTQPCFVSCGCRGASRMTRWGRRRGRGRSLQQKGEHANTWRRYPRPRIIQSQRGLAECCDSYG